MKVPRRAGASRKDARQAIWWLRFSISQIEGRPGLAIVCHLAATHWFTQVAARLRGQRLTTAPRHIVPLAQVSRTSINSHAEFLFAFSRASQPNAARPAGERRDHDPMFQDGPG